ncbi:MAG: SDR family NAD(P)-dependent oxidoreductase [Rhodoferax sp.]|nr:SDR family NAD(P)-dependent oxidoreductase [Rhodoferax sp.]
MTSPVRTVLITGCSSGIGAALAQEFHARGHKVIATARKLDSIAPHAAAGMTTLALDVNDPTSIAQAVASVQASHGHIDILVNNAGYGQFGAMMDLAASDLRAQFETNVVAPVMVTQAFVPLLRKSTLACVAHVSSISGIVTTPFAGAYCASKAALNAIGDAMRMELVPLGIQVVTIQPGGIASNFGNAGQEKVRLPAASLYQPIAKFIEKRAQLSQNGATPANAFAHDVVNDLLTNPPPPISKHGAQSTRLPLLKRLLPTHALDRKMRKLFGLDRL